MLSGRVISTDDTAKVLIKIDLAANSRVFKQEKGGSLAAICRSQGMAVTMDAGVCRPERSVSSMLNCAGRDSVATTRSIIRQPTRNRISSHGSSAGTAVAARVRGLRSTERRVAAPGCTNTTSDNTSGCDTGNLRTFCIEPFTCYGLCEPPDTAIARAGRGAKRDFSDLSFYTRVFFPSGVNVDRLLQLLRLQKIRNAFFRSTGGRIRYPANLFWHVGLRPRGDLGHLMRGGKRDLAGVQGCA